MNRVQKFRPIKSIIIASFFYIFTIGLCIQTFITSEILIAVKTTLWVTFANLVCYVILQRPSLSISEAGLKIVNPFDTWQIGWDEIQDLTTKFVLNVETRNAIIPVWVATSPARSRHEKLTRSDIRGMGFDGMSSISVGESPKSDSGVAAYLIRQGIKDNSGKGALLRHGTSREVHIRTNSLLILTLSSATVLSFIH